MVLEPAAAACSAGPLALQLALPTCIAASMAALAAAARTTREVVQLPQPAFLLLVRLLLQQSHAPAPAALCGGRARVGAAASRQQRSAPQHCPLLAQQQHLLLQQMGQQPAGPMDAARRGML